MEFKSLQDLIRYVDSAFALQFYSGASVLRKGVLKVLASVIGGSLYMISLLCRKIWKNRFLTTCDAEALPGFGVEFSLPHKSPTYSRGYVDVVLASGSTSASVPLGTYLVDPITNREYRTILSTEISESNASIRVVAASAGADYNADEGTELQWRDSTPTGLEDTCEVSGGGLFGGYSVDVSIDGIIQQWGESAEEYRARLLERYRNPPHGGSESDYKQQAERFDFVSKAFVIPCQPEAGYVCVMLANFNTEQIAVQSDDVSEVEDYICSQARRVITANVLVFSVTPVDYTIRAGISPNNQEVQESVDSALKAFFADTKPGTSVLFENLSDYVRANSLATSFDVLAVMRNGVAVSSFSLDFDPENSLGEVAKITTQYVSEA